MSKKIRKLLGYSKPRRKIFGLLNLMFYFSLGIIGQAECYETCSEAMLETEKSNVTCTYECFEPHKRVLICKIDAERPTPIACKSSSDCPTSRCELAKCTYNCIDKITNHTSEKDYQIGLRLCVEIDEKRYNRQGDFRWTRPKERPDCIGYFSCGKDSQSSVILTGAIVGGILVLIILCLVGKQKYNRRGAHCAIPQSALLDDNALSSGNRRNLDVRLDFLENCTPSPIPSPSMDAPPHYNSVVNVENQALPPTYDEAVKLKQQLIELETDIDLIVEDELPEPKPSDKLL